MTTGQGTRTAWRELPGEIHRVVESVLGSPVVVAASQTSGFSPGSADRVETASGRRAFVKTANGEQNAGSVALHRQEIRIMGGLDARIPAPRLLGSYDEDGWVVLIVEDIAGRHPGEALDGGGVTDVTSDVTAVLDALGSLPRVNGGVPPASQPPGLAAEPDLPGLPEVSAEIAALAHGWSDLVTDDGLGDLPEWVRDDVDRLQSIAAEAASAVAGDHLVHGDCRADNVLIDGASRVWILDWPAASVGASWVDGLTFLLDARVRGERVDAETLIRTHAVFADASAARIDAGLAALCGGFLSAAHRPAPPNMPTIRRFQYREGLAAAEWLRERWGS